MNRNTLIALGAAFAVGITIARALVVKRRNEQGDVLGFLEAIEEVAEEKKKKDKKKKKEKKVKKKKDAKKK